MPRIATRRASISTKAKIYSSYVLQSIGYYAPHITLSLDDTRTNLDKPVQNQMPNGYLSKNKKIK